MDELIIFIVLLLLVLYWWNSSTAYEVAYRAAKLSCTEHELTLLDDTLQVKKLRLCRHPNGYMQFCRLYQFEFSSDGIIRYKGKLSLTGQVVESVEMEAYRL